MNNKDTLQRFLFEDHAVRGELVHLNQSFETIVNQHAYPKFIQRLLGEALVLVSLLSATIKFKGRVTLQFQGNDKMKLLLAQCNEEFHIRGLAQYSPELTEEGLEKALQQGTLAIMIDPESQGQRYQGIVSWQGKSLAEAVEGYFKDSEQLDTRIDIAVGEEGASGLLLQVIPHNGDEKDFLFWEHINHLTATIRPEELLNLDNETIIYRLFSEENIRLFQTDPIIFRCTCDVKRGENAIALLGREEAEEELKGKQQIVVTCEFCNHQFIFDKVDVERIFRKDDSPPSSDQVH